MRKRAGRRALALVGTMAVAFVLVALVAGPVAAATGRATQLATGNNGNGHNGNGNGHNGNGNGNGNNGSNGNGHDDHGNGNGYGHCDHGNGNGYGHSGDDCGGHGGHGFCDDYTSPVVTVSPNHAHRGQAITISGVGFPPGSPITLLMVRFPTVFPIYTLGVVTTTSAGDFSVTAHVPAYALPGLYSVFAFDGLCQRVAATRIVVQGGRIFTSGDSGHGHSVVLISRTASAGPTGRGGVLSHTGGFALPGAAAVVLLFGMLLLTGVVPRRRRTA